MEDMVMESGEGRADHSAPDQSTTSLEETVKKHANGQRLSPIAKILPCILGAPDQRISFLGNHSCYLMRPQ